MQFHMWSKFFRILKRIQVVVYHNLKLYSRHEKSVFDKKAGIVFDDSFYSSLISCYDIRDIISAGNELLDDNYYYFSNCPLKVSNPNDLWFLDIYSSYRWDKNVYFGDTVIRPNQQGVDIKIPWEISRLHHLVTLSICYRETGDERFKRKIIKDLTSFISQNRPGMGCNWVYSMEVSIRLANIILALDIAFKGEIDPEINDIDKYIDYCIEHIMDNIEWRGGIRNNHYFISLFGLYIASKRFSRNYRNRVISTFASKEIVNEISKHILPDGGGIEQSTSYHRLNLEMIAYYFFLKNDENERLSVLDRIYFLFHFPFLPIDLKFRRQESSNKAKQRFFKGLGFLKSITVKNGSFPLIGDNDSGRIFKITKKSNESWHFCNYFTQFITKYDYYDGNDINQSSLLQLKDDIAFKELISIKSKDEHLKCYHYPKFGLLILRGLDLLLSIKLPPLGEYIAGHSHEDDYTISIFYRNEWIFQDNGTYSYNVDRNRYFKEKMASSHNFVSNLKLSGKSKVFLDKSSHLAVYIFDANKILYRISNKNGYLKVYHCCDISFVDNERFSDYFVSIG